MGVLLFFLVGLGDYALATIPEFVNFPSPIPWILSFALLLACFQAGWLRAQALHLSGGWNMPDIGKSNPRISSEFPSDHQTLVDSSKYHEAMLDKNWANTGVRAVMDADSSGFATHIFATKSNSLMSAHHRRFKQF